MRQGQPMGVVAAAIAAACSLRTACSSSDSAGGSSKRRSGDLGWPILCQATFARIHGSQIFNTCERHDDCSRRQASWNPSGPQCPSTA